MSTQLYSCILTEPLNHNVTIFDFFCATLRHPLPEHSICQTDLLDHTTEIVDLLSEQSMQNTANLLKN